MKTTVECSSVPSQPAAYLAWISDMSQIRSIEKFAVDEFSDLLVHRGFSPPQVLRESMKARLEFIKDSFAIEVELDWREFVAFVLVVRLENGSLPSGCYMSGGTRVRKHLAKVIQEQKWETPTAPRFDRGRSRSESSDDMKDLLLGYKEQLSACVDKLVLNGASVI